jgi:glutaredoxin
LEVVYEDVTKDSSAMQKMMELTGGKRDVPVILEGEKVTIGHGGS